MTDKEFFIYTLKDELPRFERVLKAVEKVPKIKHSYKHDKKSRTTLELMNTLASEAVMFPIILKTGNLDFTKLPKQTWKSIGGGNDVFLRNMKLTCELAQKMSQKQWDSKAEMWSGDKMDWQSTRGKMIWAFLLDLIHHRGQLSTYLRPMGGKVPSIYGPSADTK